MAERVWEGTNTSPKNQCNLLEGRRPAKFTRGHDERKSEKSTVLNQEHSLFLNETV